MMHRVCGTTQCLGCGQTVAVVYPYSNSDVSLGLVDHQTNGKRCLHAGLSIWSIGHGWTEYKFRQRYGSAGIKWSDENAHQRAKEEIHEN